MSGVSVFVLAWGISVENAILQFCQRCCVEWQLVYCSPLFCISAQMHTLQSQFE